MANPSRDEDTVILEELHGYRRIIDLYWNDSEVRDRFWAKYLFFLKAPDYLKSKGIDISYVMDRGNAPVRLAMDLILSTLFGFRSEEDEMDEHIAQLLEEEGISYGELPAPTDDMERRKWFTAYLLSRMLVSAYPDQVIINHYARNLARHLYSVIRRDATPVDISVILEEMGIPHTTKVPRSMVHSIDSVTETANITVSLDWAVYLSYGGEYVRTGRMKLVNRKLVGGMVEIPYKDTVRLMQEFMNHRIGQNLPAPVSTAFLETYSEEIELLKKVAAIIGTSSVEITAGVDQLMPPA